jgi:threonine/homoserine/homoserine lactone efflux protein
VIADSLVAFVAAAGLLTLTPGADTALVLRTAIASGPRAAIFAGAGVGLGCLAWGASVSAGFGVLVAASATAFRIVKYAGAGYLFWLGLGLLLRPRGAMSVGAPGTARGGSDALRRGLLTNLLNPKVGVFYVTFLPQFVPGGVNVAGFSFLLAGIHALLGVAWFGVVIAATAPVARVLARPRVVAAFDRVTGCVFLAFGVKLALAEG